jgi:hypothetical protein
LTQLTGLGWSGLEHVFVEGNKNLQRVRLWHKKAGPRITRRKAAWRPRRYTRMNTKKEPKAEIRKQTCFAKVFPVRASTLRSAATEDGSDFGFLSGFGFRISDFED